MKDNTRARLLAYVTPLVNQELLLRNDAEPVSVGPIDRP